MCLCKMIIKQINTARLPFFSLYCTIYIFYAIICSFELFTIVLKHVSRNSLRGLDRRNIIMVIFQTADVKLTKHTWTSLPICRCMKTLSKSVTIFECREWRRGINQTNNRKEQCLFRQTTWRGTIFWRKSDWWCLPPWPNFCHPLELLNPLLVNLRLISV